jgi:hypothetical protein
MMIKLIISRQIKPSVGTFPLLVIESDKKLFTQLMTGFELESIAGFPVKISCMKGISMPMEMMEKTTLKRVKRK